jgi:hypothetical protein
MNFLPGLPRLCQKESESEESGGNSQCLRTACRDSRVVNMRGCKGSSSRKLGRAIAHTIWVSPGGSLGNRAKAVVADMASAESVKSCRLK